MQNEQQYRIQHYKIRHYDPRIGICDLKFNKGQWKLWNAIKWFIDHNLPIRIIMVKARQWGGSTLINAFITDETVFKEHVRSMFMAHATKTAQHLLRMSKIHFAHMPVELIIPEMEYNTMARKEFRNGSELTIESAKNVDAGAGETLNHLHLSEFARFEHPDLLMTSLEPSLPDLPWTSEFIESTAQGKGNEFDERWQIAVEAKNKHIPGGFEPIFVGWHEIERYTRPFEHEKEKYPFEKSMTKHERFLLERFKCTLEQMNWYRWVLAAKCKGDERRRRQEYPCTAREAFLTTGNPRFQVEVLDGWFEKARIQQEATPCAVYTVTPEGEFIPDEFGNFRVYKEPEKIRGTDERRVIEYLVTVDTAEGIEVSEDGQKRDESVIHVWRRGNMYIDPHKEYYDLEEVAIWRGYIEVIPLANISFHIGMWYNQALLGCERAGSGATFCDYLVHHRTVPYPFMYHHFITDHATQKRSKIIGFKNSSATRTPMIDLSAQMIEEGDILVHDMDVIDQLMSFKRNSKGKPEAEKGKRDDAVMTLCMACQINIHYRNFKQPADSITKDDTMRQILARIKRDAGKGPKKPGLNPKILIDPEYAPIHVRGSRTV